MVYAEACMMNGDYANASSCVESLLKFVNESDKVRVKPNELGEILMFGVRALMRQDKPAEALAFLAKHEPKILNQTKRAQYKAELLGTLGKTKESVEVWEELL